MNIPRNTVHLIVTYLVEHKRQTNNRASDMSYDLYKAVRKKFLLDRDELSRNILQRLEEMPEDEERKLNLEKILIKKTGSDLSFKEELSRLMGAKDSKTGLVRVSTGEKKRSSSNRSKDNGLVRVARSKETRHLRMPKHAEDAHKAESPNKIVRYPELDCPANTILHQRVSIFVWLLIEPPSPDADAIIIEDAGLPEELPEVEVVISARGFDVEGSNTRTLKVNRDDDSDERFVLIPSETGEKQIRADFYQHGRRIGTLRRNVLVAEVPVEVEVRQPDESIPLDLKVAPMVPPPDLEIYVELDRQDGRTLYFRLHSTKESVGYNHAKFGQVTLQGTPLEKMQSLYKELSLMAGQSAADAERRMNAIGNNLWDELIPDELKREYWFFRSRVESLLITSDEPWVPWEAIKPYRYDENDEREDDPFWCLQFRISRWLSGRGAVEDMPVGMARPIAPTQVNLAAVTEEVAFIEQLGQLDPNVKGEPPIGERALVLDFMEKEAFSILHFASHAGFDATMPDNSTIMLSDGPLRPSDIQTRFGGRRPRPLIFINACEGAQMEFGFTGLGGWAERLVNGSHVGAFIGAMWEVNDTLALKFARRFYTALLRDKQPIAQAFRMARESIKDDDPSNSTWLAYVLYADPEGRFVG